MKKSIYFYTLIFAISLILVSCADTGLRHSTAYHYVAAYYPVDSFHIAVYRNSNPTITKEVPILLEMIGDFDGGVNYTLQTNVYSDTYEDWSYKPTEEQYNKYIELCNKHEDYGYKHEIQILHTKRTNNNNGLGYVYGYTYWDITPISIDVISDADYDEMHPAGVPLNDIVLFTTFSPYQFIKNGYTGKEFVKNKKTLNQYTQDDFKLIFCVGSAPIYKELDEDNYQCISFTTEPTINKEHTLTVTIKDDYGRTFSDTTTVIFK